MLRGEALGGLGVLSGRGVMWWRLVTGRPGAGHYVGLLVGGLAKDFLECFEHGLLVVELGKNRASV
ncbi:hypothetical protein B597_017045 [Stutzerimonas stutzeri KOS6]|uniref:Uncharacterized protein n=1 Tax=Stutzerimonas stutzeri KOS6 TaxID=1218352 RepID=A0A061JKB7_STUST|nr:hypothetical protein B597_017045 [Stutzerimonas stutzeri KOS6]